MYSSCDEAGTNCWRNRSLDYHKKLPDMKSVGICYAPSSLSAGLTIFNLIRELHLGYQMTFSIIRPSNYLVKITFHLTKFLQNLGHAIRTLDMLDKNNPQHRLFPGIVLEYLLLLFLES